MLLANSRTVADMKDEIETIPLEQRNLSPRELCQLENLSPTSLQKLERMGMGPAWTLFPGINVRRCTPQARADWHARMAAWRAENAAKLESERKARIERAVVLGKMSASSPGHPSHKKKKAKR